MPTYQRLEIRGYSRSLAPGPLLSEHMPLIVVILIPAPFFERFQSCGLSQLLFRWNIKCKCMLATLYMQFDCLCCPSLKLCSDNVRSCSAYDLETISVLAIPIKD